MRSVNNRLLFSVIAILVIAFGLGLYLALKPDRNGKVDTNSYLDQWTGEVVTDPEGKDVDTYGTDNNEPIYLGVDKLLDHGFSFQQIQNLKTAINNYSKSKGNSVNEVSIKVDAIVDTRVPTDPNAPYETTFDIKFNRKDIYKAKIQYFGITDLRLYLSDQNGQTFYDSGVIDIELID